jgi:tRNA A-37 threonylcarbamoyl transferase component Bud32
MPAQAKSAPRDRAFHDRGDGSPVGSILDGRYRVISLLEKGAMGEVYLGERIGIERRVALKFLSPSLTRDLTFLKRFGIEAKALGRLSHPNCVSVIDFGGHSAPYLVMDLVGGTSLRAIIDQGALPADRAVAIARQMLAGLGHAHSRGIIHRDAKPENVVLESAIGVRGDHVRILDFGLAKLRDDSSDLTKGMLLGTPCYLSPEQLSGAEIDERADIYTCGIVLYEMLTGRCPFDGNLGETLLAQKQMPPPPMRAVAPEIAIPAPLEAVIRRALEKSAGDRFASALEMITALDDGTASARDHEGIEELSEADLIDDDATLVLAPISALGAHWHGLRARVRPLVRRTRGTVQPLVRRAGRGSRAAWIAMGIGVRRAATLAGPRLRGMGVAVASAGGRTGRKALPLVRRAMALAARGVARGRAKWATLPRRARLMGSGALGAFTLAFAVVLALLPARPPASIAPARAPTMLPAPALPALDELALDKQAADKPVGDNSGADKVATAVPTVVRSQGGRRPESIFDRLFGASRRNAAEASRTRTGKKHGAGTRSSQASLAKD